MRPDRKAIEIDDQMYQILLDGMKTKIENLRTRSSTVLWCSEQLPKINMPEDMRDMTEFLYDKEQTAIGIEIAKIEQQMQQLQAQYNPPMVINPLRDRGIDRSVAFGSIGDDE